MFYVEWGGTKGFDTQLSKEIKPQTLLGMVLGGNVSMPRLIIQ